MASPALPVNISAPQASMVMGELTKSSFGSPHHCSIRGQNQGAAASCTDPAEMLGMDRAGGALLLCTVCPCSSDICGDAQMDPHRPPEDPLRPQGCLH